MTKAYLNPPELFNSVQYGFSQVVVSTPGRKQVHLSGQVAWDAAQTIVGAGDIGAQTRQTLRNIETAMQLAGGSLADVVSLRLYIVDYDSTKAPPITAALQEFFPDMPPAATWIGVQALANEGFMIEIEALGIID